MNKLGFCSGILSIILAFLQSIPVGIYFSSGISSFTAIPLNLFSSGTNDFYIWGTIDQTSLAVQWWVQINLISFILLYIFIIFTGITTIIGSTMEKSSGKALMTLNTLLLIITIIYISVFIPLNSLELIGDSLDFTGMFSSLGNGYYLLIINFILALISVRVHPLESE